MIRLRHWFMFRLSRPHTSRFSPCTFRPQFCQCSCSHGVHEEYRHSGDGEPIQPQPTCLINTLLFASASTQLCSDTGIAARARGRTRDAARAHSLSLSHAIALAFLTVMRSHCLSLSLSLSLPTLSLSLPLTFDHPLDLHPAVSHS